VRRATKKTSIALIGFMGVGKSTLGALLAQKASLGFFDIDAQIEADTGMSISQIFDACGEKFFRDAEHEMCKKISTMERFVISCGGGIVLNPQNITLLQQNCTVAHLTASPETIFNRTAIEKNRPLLAEGDKLAKIKTLLAEREHLYKQSADFSVCTEDKTPDELISELLKALKV